MDLNRLLKYRLLALIVLLVLMSCSIKQSGSTYVNLVNPLIGTAPSTTISALQHGEDEKENNAQVVPYVTVPFGMTNWTAQTKSTETKCVAPYYYTDTKISGFRGSHWLSGSCVQDYGSMTIMPITGKLKCQADDRASHFSHDTEKTSPYNYNVNLADYHIDVSMTATKRCGLFQFTFENSGEAHIIVNPNSDEGEGFIQINADKNEIVGYNPVHKIYQGWGDKAGFSGYFVVQLSKSSKKFGVYQNEKILEGKIQIANQENIGAYISFMVEKGETIEAKIGTSFTSIEQARKNLVTETKDLDFDEAKENLKNTWESLLSKVKVEGTNKDEKVKFYTAMYHSYLQPRTFNDVDGTYVSFNGGQQLMNSGKEDYFTDYSMWDIYRSSLPLFNLLTPKVNGQMMKSLFSMAEQGGWMPIFPCWNSYTSAMIGDHAIAAIADAYLKNNIEISDKEYAYLLKNAFQSPDNHTDYVNGKGRRALTSYLKYGFVPLEDEVKESFHKGEQVSRTLEYAFDDFALSQIAAKRGDTLHARLLKKRALNYQNVYSVADSVVRGRFADGTFTKDFDKFIRKPYITEGTPYQYTWYVPQDIKGLMNLMGGEDGFNANLDRFHAAGQYWHGNEPGHQIPFLYNYSGQAWKTQELVTQIMKTEYSNDVGGLSGNDDAGQMSAWYVFAALGFYPVAPSVPQYVISGPHFDKITLNLENGKKLIINAKGASSGNNYIQKIKFNGVEYDKTYLDHFSIMKGGVLDFEMNNQPNKLWGTAKESRPFSLSNH